MTDPHVTSGGPPAIDHANRAEFVDYYAAQSAAPETVARFRRLRDDILRIARLRSNKAAFDVADIGCGAGTFSQVWAEAGHRARGLDVSADLVELARRRAADASLPIAFEIGTATALPWADESVDICCAPELLEHVADWRRCLDEFARVLRPGGVLCLGTTNWLCPRQHEYNLPLYSWYPGFMKRRVERLAMTSRPNLANHATYPALHWFSFYRLRREFRQRGLTAMDRFDTAALRPDNPRVRRLILGLIRTVPPVRLLAHVLTEGTWVAGIKTAGAPPGPA